MHTAMIGRAQMRSDASVNASRRIIFPRKLLKSVRALKILEEGSETDAKRRWRYALMHRRAVPFCELNAVKKLRDKRRVLLLEHLTSIFYI